EAENAQGEAFGQARLEQGLRQSTGRDLLADLQHRLASHMGERLPHDDLSCLLLECTAEIPQASRNQPAHSEVAQDWQLQLALGAPQLRRLDLAPMVSNLCNNLGLEPEKQGALALILNELLS